MSKIERGMKKMKKTTSEVEELQKEWGGKPCNHDQGFGYEIDDSTGCNCDCFCVICGMRHTNQGFFEKRKRK